MNILKIKHNTIYTCKKDKVYIVKAKNTKAPWLFLGVKLGEDGVTFDYYSLNGHSKNGEKLERKATHQVFPKGYKKAMETLLKNVDNIK